MKQISAILVLVAVAAVSAFPTESKNPQPHQGRNDLESQEPVKIVPVVVLTENGKHFRTV